MGPHRRGHREATAACKLLVLLAACIVQASCQGCESGQFRCGNGRCIPSDWRCDGARDCSDDSDEVGCPHPTCDGNHFQCHNDGECIPQSWVCDDEEDCEDGSDEQQCPGRTCSSRQFTCSNGQCVPSAYRCDRVKDCVDGTDERGCQYPACDQLTCSNGACFNASQHCDGKVDCRDASDETNCTHGCTNTQFQCANGECIPRAFVCDHDDDCGDRSDEHSCTYASCKGNFFTCPSGRCIHQSWICDGDDDCEDNADEIGCESGHRDCYPGEWACPVSGQCMPIGKFCDGTPDCSGGEDETNITAGRHCNISRCAALSCQYRCHSSPSGGTCYCPAGYVISINDSRTCIDFDDCKMWGVCDQRCEDRVGHHQCHCAEGYVLEHHRHCRANTSSGYAYFTDWRLGGIVRVRKTDGGEMTVIRRGINNIMHVKAYNAHAQIGTNYCNRATNPNGDCSHFCFPVPNFQRVCGCPYGMKLSSNQLTCVEDPSNEPPTLQCGSYSFSCGNGRCVPRYYQCDGVNDCHDNSDEQDCGTQNNTCSTSAFTCRNGQCIPRRWQCDKHSDCLDGSDELHCPTQGPASCPAALFTCDNGKCIPRIWLCDTDNDCGDGSDEKNCTVTETCEPGQFQCPDHRCIDPFYVCDGDRDCVDGTDEQDCTYNCTSSQFKCASGDQCINNYFQCDGVFDCNDHSDEADCPTRPTGMCHQNEFQCQSDGNCIPATWECDGHPDCADSSDEHHRCPPRTCPPSLFRCDNGNCVYRAWICDGDNDCRDMSDERDCPTPPFRCPSWQWQCPGHSVCVNLSRVCDNLSDCPNGADESPLCNEPQPDQESCSDNNAGCTHECIQGPFGAQCSCPFGYQLANDSKTCEDINECDPPGFCSQYCHNERGSFRCYCDEGYVLETNQRTCKVAESGNLLLLVASRNQIVADNITSHAQHIYSLVRDGRNIVAIDFDSVTGRIFWSDVTQDKIWTAYQNGTDRKVVFDSGVTVTESLAVDWVGRNLYWTDFVLETIEVSRLDGSHRTVLISENITNPRGLVLDPRIDAHLMFWTDWGRNPRIERASMDGTLRTAIVTSKVYWPNGLAIDYPNRLLYFADAYLDYIDFCDYNGNNRRQVVASDLVLQHPHALTIFEDFVYWSEKYTNRVIRANKWHGGNQTVVIYNIHQPLGIMAVHPVNQPSGTNSCASSSCSHLCLLSSLGPRFYSCACPSGWTLSPDNVNCMRVEEPFLIAVRDTIIYGISLNPGEKTNDAMVPIAGVQNGVDADFDDTEQMIYWVESPGEIHRVKSDGTNRTVFAPAAIIGSPFGLALDWISGNLYYSNPATQSIEVLKLHSEVVYRKTLITNDGTSAGSGMPTGLTVDPVRGKLYWTDQGTHTGIPAKIAGANMDGSDIRTLFTGNLDHVEFITLDIKEQKLYWPVTSTGVIERGNVDGTNRMTLVSHLSHPWGVAVYGSFLYYTDRDYEVIERVDKSTGANKVVLRDNVSRLKCLRVYYRDNSSGSSNGCSNNAGICQQLCLPVPGGLFSCACATGFQLNPDNRTCSPYNSFVVVSMLSAIKGFSLETSDHSEAMVPLAGRGRNALHVDVHIPSGFIYWCDFSSSVRSQNAIRRIKPDGSSFTNIITDGIGRNGIRGIAVDWVSGNLYFTNAFLSETFIEVLRLNTTYRRVLLKTTVDMPRHIVVDPKNRYLFWADYGQNPKIERAFLDTTNRTILVSEGIVTPRGLAVDHNNGYVYWVDDSLDMIARISQDGGEPEIVRYGSRYPTPYGITVFENSMIWVDRNLKKIFQASKEPGNTEAPTVMRDNINWLRDVTIYNSRYQSRSPSDINHNPCLENNGGCSHLCFALPDLDAPKCGCAFGLVDSSGKSCSISTDDYLIFALENALKSLHLDPENHSPPFQTVNVLRTAVALDYDSVNNVIYFTQSSPSGTGKISYLHTHSGTGRPTIIASDLGTPDGLAFDWINNRIYYSDYLNQTISSMAVDGSNRSVVAHVPRPRAIVLDPCQGYMYWTDWSSNAKIERATLGGNFRTAIVSTDLVWPNGLTLDYEEQQLYWADANLQKIERSSLTGTNREVIVSTALYPFAMTLFDQHIYWTDWNTRSIYRANKFDGSDQIVMISNLPSRPMDIHVWAESKQQKCTNLCNQFNGGCSHICVTGPTGAECQCPSEGRWYLANNNKHCVADNGTRCTEGLFTCLNGRCISERWKCDNDNDCGDGSDELESVCAFHTCQPTAFTCGNGRCVPYPYRCDHYNDCGDNSDEVGCLFRTCDPHTEFTCNNGRCISLEYVCNGVNNCYDNGTSDERNCPERTCQPGYTKCQSTNICIPRTYLCDGDNDCGDMSDESPTHCVSLTCTNAEFRCSSGRCIPAHWYCDQATDCADGSDEPSSCVRPVRSCSSDQFRCDDGRCIPASWICDGDNDCGDMSDEDQRHSCANRSCTALEFTCVNNGPSQRRCIPKAWVCDGDADCSDAYDEHQNCTRRPCLDSEFMCSNGLCIRSAYRCDRRNDCGDNSDERGCTYQPCTQHQFTCQNGRCITKAYVCDGDNDCGDESDESEHMCVTPEATCPPHFFKCDNGNCIAMTNICNRIDNCLDNSDEKGCGINECNDPSISGCDHDCTDTQTSFYCSCHPGYRLMSNKKTCDDIDECSETPSVCSQICENTIGSYICKCAPGYIREPDGKRCRQNSNISPYLIFSNRYYLRNLTTDGLSYSLILQGLGNVVALDFDRVEKRLYWIDVGRRIIERMFLNGTNKEIIINDGVPSGEGIAVDWVGRKLYWVDAYKNCLYVAELDGRFRKKLVDRCLDSNNTFCFQHPRAVVVHPKYGHVYWTDWAERPYIGRAGMDGKNKTVVVSTKLEWPNGLTIDYTNDKLYWADAHLNYIEYSDLDGRHRHTVYDGSLPHPFAITIFEDTIYWTDWNTRTVEKGNKYDGSDRAVLVNTTHRPFDIHVYHPYRQPIGPRECTESEYRCDNLRCIPSRWICDHDNDCEDNSDERDCELRTCHPGYFQCDSGHCIAQRFQCDGSADCLDFSDEATCPTRYPNGTYCSRTMFECKNHVCIQPHWKCDGDDDCGDGSDEELHLCLDVVCEPPFRFRCGNNRCIYNHELCNHEDDCGDGSDEEEEHCREPTPKSCTTEEFKCGNGNCIPLHYVCDNYDDCGDHFDELGCNSGTGRTCAENICEHNCTNLSEGSFICTCRPGYRPSEENRNTCDDINECEIFGTCPQICKNSKGSYECFCAEGFRSVGDRQGTQCAATGNPPILLLPDNIRIRKYNMTSEQYSDYIDNEEHIQAIDYDWDPEGIGLSIVYYSILGRGAEFGSIKRAYIPTFESGGNNPVKEVDLNLKYLVSPVGLAVDWVGRHLYWTDAGTNRVEVAKLDGRYRKWLVYTLLDQPAAIAINPKLGLMYWTDWGRQPKIESAWMDGQHRQSLISEDLGWPTGLSIDYLNNDRIYWSDVKENLIESMRPDGTDRKIVVQGVNSPFSLDVFEGHLYWMSKERGEVWKEDKFGKGEKIKVLTINPWLTQVRIYHQHRCNQSVANPCKDVCSHLCLLRPGGYSCACPQGARFVEGSSTECDAAIEPPPTMPPACRCMYGGTCYIDEDGFPKCKCSNGYTGSYCEVGLSKGVPAGTTVAVLLTVILIIIVGALAVGGFLNYRRTGSLLPALPKLPSLSSLVKSTENGDGVTFRSGADGTMNISVSGFGAESAIDRAMQMNETFATETGKQPITFENPMYTTRDSGEVDMSVAPPTQVTASSSERNENFENPIYDTSVSASVPQPLASTETPQETKWNFFKRKLKQSTNFENPIYSEMEKEHQGEAENIPPPSPSLPQKIILRRDQPLAYSATEDSFKDTANLVKEDSVV
ncbi:low-density lipoprotein receptor-related protein 2 [Sphaerodactylus townsendi]|uniref:low-density lipoprotein receptor-related protein 2 n=1 Tax=Sphaerodactylus townsendi TaxID=933632 RepID=UPI00202634C0|nr:low-density lipoprotein receptor-related protein 2 [Sphaerodactylus townsendi]